jgi:hypothetical protein
LNENEKIKQEIFKMKKIRILNKKIFFTFFILFSFISLVFALTFIDKLQSDFDLGIYNNTLYNSSIGDGAVQLNLSFNNGTYTSQIFSTGSNVSFNNLSWEYQRIQNQKLKVRIVRKFLEY